MSFFHDLKRLVFISPRKIEINRPYEKQISQCKESHKYALTWSLKSDDFSTSFDVEG